MWNKNKLPLLDQEEAAVILQEVFESCDVPPNQIEIETLASYSNYRNERFTFQKVIIILMLILFCLLPILFIAPKIELTKNTNYEPGRPTYTISVDSIIPISGINIYVGDTKLPVSQIENHIFSVKPSSNGKMEVTVDLANKQYDSRSTTVDDVDLVSPTLLSNEKIDQNLYLYLADEDSGINYNEIYAMNDKNEKIYPVSVDKEKACVCFAYPKESMNVFVPDNVGNELQLVITIK